MTQPRDARGRFVSQDVREEFTEAEREFIRRCVRENPTIVRSVEEQAAIAAQAAHPRQHWSDCAVHRAPAYDPGPCDCGGIPSKTYEELFEAWSSAQKLRKPRRRWWWPFGRK
jgi:hypothetical protein